MIGLRIGEFECSPFSVTHKNWIIFVPMADIRPVSAVFDTIKSHTNTMRSCTTRNHTKSDRTQLGARVGLVTCAIAAGRLNKVFRIECVRSTSTYMDVCGGSMYAHAACKHAMHMPAAWGNGRHGSVTKESNECAIQTILVHVLMCCECIVWPFFSFFSLFLVSNR